MNDTAPTGEVNLADRMNRSSQANHILWELRQPLDKSRVKRRQAPGMGSVPYLEGCEIIHCANSIFRFAWSFDLTCEPVIVRWQKKVLIWNQKEKRKIPSLDAHGNFLTEEVGLVYITGKVIVELAGKQYIHADLGRCVFTGDTPEVLDMALTSSVTDCLRRCFRQWDEQVANLLYAKDIAQTVGLERNRSISPASSPCSTSSTPVSIPAIRKYDDEVSGNGIVSEQEALDQFNVKASKVPASKGKLRTWLASQRSISTPASAAV